MNKYQRYCFLGFEEPNGKHLKFFKCIPAVWENHEYKGNKNSSFVYGVFDEKNDLFNVFQDEDIAIVDYVFIANLPVCFESISYFRNEKWNLVEFSRSSQSGEKLYRIPLSFEDKISKIKLTFKNNIADDYIFSLKYVEADKDLYYQKQEAARKANILQTAQIKHSVGADLVNIYFQPCCDDYEYTEIYLYIPQDYITSFGGLKKPSSWQLFKKCKVPSEDFYKSINGLAYGTYAYVIKQFDKKDNLLLETEYIEFSLKAPKQPIMGRINRI